MLFAAGAVPGLSLAVPLDDALPTLLIVVQALVFAAQFTLMFVLQKRGGPVYLSLLGSVGAVVAVPIAVLLARETPPRGLALGANADRTRRRAPDLGRRSARRVDRRGRSGLIGPAVRPVVRLAPDRASRFLATSHRSRRGRFAANTARDRQLELVGAHPVRRNPRVGTGSRLACETSKRAAMANGDAGGGSGSSFATGTGCSSGRGAVRTARRPGACPAGHLEPGESVEACARARDRGGDGPAGGGRDAGRLLRIRLRGRGPSLRHAVRRGARRDGRSRASRAGQVCRVALGSLARAARAPVRATGRLPGRGRSGARPCGRPDGPSRRDRVARGRAVAYRDAG